MATDYMAKITELRAQKSTLLTQAEALVSEGKFDEADKITDQMVGINTNIKQLERLSAASK